MMALRPWPWGRLLQTLVAEVPQFLAVESGWQPMNSLRSQIPGMHGASGQETPLGPLPMSRLTVTPESALIDEPVHIRATGLPPSELVTLKASLTDEKGNLFHSRAFYRTNKAGELDLKQDAAVGGDYVGVEPMGLFWSLKPKKAFKRLLKKDVMNSPYRVTLDLYDTFSLKESATEKPKASQTVQRWFSAPGLQRVPIRVGRVRGALFLPPGEGPFPGIIDLFGGIGGLVEFRASLLASRGFAALALAYFAYEDLPSHLEEVDLEYFEEAANFLLSQPKVQGPGVGVIGVSKGGEIALGMACFLRQVVATVCINAPTWVSDMPHRYRDQVLSSLPVFPEFIQIDVSGAANYRNYQMAQSTVNLENLLPVEKAQGPILFLASESDGCLDSIKCAEQAIERLHSHGKSNGRMLSYPGAGHLLEPPYGPLCYASWNPNLPLPLLWGGDTARHAAAQEHSWGEILKFFRQHLVQTTSKL
ncbi:bile acid-CoA:amino acid N-acyltransferase isoform X2 [Talpa occidentalis]|uniref:bile acid-CoA:amino acid N-acyltransferase isoform X2 n=1 Tax=Talpa occidentalis TaxID=50954 RepID=UPI00188F4D7C|nr:bile acid-CoA:amino acid N-acyltransferase isoform X2 [Talpa occidentalis]